MPRSLPPARPVLRLLLATLLLLPVLAPAASAQRPRRAGRATQGEEFSLFIGEQTTLPTDGVANYSVGNKEVIEVKLTPDQRRFVIKGIAEGESTLLLIFDDGRQVIHRFVVRQRRAREGVVRRRENIRLDLYFVELRRNATLQLGIGWPTSITAETGIEFNANFTNSAVDLTTTVASTVLPRIDMLHATGWAKLRRHAAIVTANGEGASFSSGGTVYVVVTGVGAARLAEINYGSDFQVTPRYDAKTGRVEIQITAQLSELGAPYTTGGPPSLLKTTAQSVVNLRLGEAVVLGGIRAANQAHNRGGLPGLSQIPILGILFGQHSWTSDDTESVLVILPTVREEPDTVHRERIGEALGLFRRYEGDFDELGSRRLFPPPPGTPTGMEPAPSSREE